MNAYEKRIEAKRARFLELAAGARRNSDQAHAQAHAIADRIVPGQPILVGHHSEGRHRRDIQRMDDNMRASIAAQDAAEHYARRAAVVGTAGVSSDDPDAIDKLREQVAQLEADQERMKAINKAIKAKAKAGAEAQAAGLVALGLSGQQAAEALKPDFAGRVGYPSYALSNNNANIRRIQGRIATLEAGRARAPVTIEGRGYVYREDPDQNRVLFEFPAKPSAEVRKLLSGAAFKWSPSRGEQGAWVRFLTAGSRYAAREIRERLDAMS